MIPISINVLASKLQRANCLWYIQVLICCVDFSPLFSSTPFWLKDPKHRWAVSCIKVFFFCIIFSLNSCDICFIYWLWLKLFGKRNVPFGSKCKRHDVVRLVWLLFERNSLFLECKHQHPSHIKVNQHNPTSSLINFIFLSPFFSVVNFRLFQSSIFSFAKNPQIKELFFLIICSRK